MGPQKHCGLPKDRFIAHPSGLWRRVPHFQSLILFFIQIMPRLPQSQSPSLREETALAFRAPPEGPGASEMGAMAAGGSKGDGQVPPALIKAPGKGTARCPG